MPPLTRCCCVKLDLACLIVRKLRKGCVHSRENSSYDPYCCTLLGRLVAQGGSKRVMLKLISISLSYTVRTRVPRMILIFSEKNTFSEKINDPCEIRAAALLKSEWRLEGQEKIIAHEGARGGQQTLGKRDLLSWFDHIINDWKVRWKNKLAINQFTINDQSRRPDQSSCANTKMLGETLEFCLLLQISLSLNYRGPNSKTRPKNVLIWHFRSV